MTPITPARRRRNRDVADLLIVFSPVLIPFALVLLLAVAFIVLMVVYAFADGFLEGLGALAGLLLGSSLILLWVSSLLRFLGVGRR